MRLVQKEVQYSTGTKNTFQLSITSHGTLRRRRDNSWLCRECIWFCMVNVQLFFVNFFINNILLILYVRTVPDIFFTSQFLSHLIIIIFILLEYQYDILLSLIYYVRRYIYLFTLCYNPPTYVVPVIRISVPWTIIFSKQIS